MSLLRRYAEVLALPGARRALVASTIGRIAAGMSGLAMILLVRAEGGSYAVAGLAAAAFSVGFAIFAPVRARRADRRGQTGVLLASAVGFPAGLLTVLLVVWTDLPIALSTVGAALAGIYFPPFGPTMRTIWSGLADGRVRTTAFALEAVLVELSFVLGPVAVAISQALGGVRTSVAVAAVLGGTGSLLLARSPLSKAWLPHPEREGHLLGPLRNARVRRLLLAVLCIGIAFGAVDVGVPAFAEEQHRIGLSGVLLAMWSLGSMIGGLVYGGINPGWSVDRQYRVLLPLVATAAALPLFGWSLTGLGLCLLGFGLGIAPFFIINSHLIAEHAPAGTTTEAFAWFGTAIFGGASIGNAVAGLLVEEHGARGAFAVTAALGLVAWLTSLRLPAGRARSGDPLAELDVPVGSPHSD